MEENETTQMTKNHLPFIRLENPTMNCYNRMSIQNIAKGFCGTDYNSDTSKLFS